MRRIISKFRNEFHETIRPLEEKYGIKISLGNLVYEDTEFYTKMEVKKVKENNDLERVLFEINCFKYGMSKEDYGRQIYWNGNDKKHYYLIGFSPNETPFVYLARCEEDNKIYKFRHVKLI